MFKNNKRPFEIIVLGPPISGKGTQADLLSKTFNIPHISTGQILHTIKDDKKNKLAKKVAGYMNQGTLVPDDFVNCLVLDRIKRKDCRWGFVLDGYPRTLEQVKVINKSTSLDYIFLIDVPDKVIVERIRGRRVCRNGHTWHLKYSPPQKKNVCDKCGLKLFQRDDDKVKIVKNRLKEYHNNMKPILSFYKSSGSLLKINGRQSIEGVFQEMVKHLVNNLRSKIYDKDKK